MFNETKKNVIRVGTAGWSYPDWYGRVYPAKKTRKINELEYLSSYFDTVEVNTSFYRPLARKISLSWIDKVKGNKHFKFTLKLWNKFTHSREKTQDNDYQIFIDGIMPLVENNMLGCILVQFPWSFKKNFKHWDRLNMVIDTFHKFPLVVEFRHSSWMTEKLLEYLKEKSVGLCNIDQPLFQNSITPSNITTSSIGYVRFHGRNYKDWFRDNAGRDARYNYLYSVEELKDWIIKIQEIARDTTQTYVFSNNHFLGQAACNALQVKHMLTRQKVKVPQPLVKHYPFLKKIAIRIEPDPEQLGLF